MSSTTREYRTWVGDSRRWSSYVPRDNDVVIATYPKSGTTWTQQIVGSLIFQTADTLPVGNISPWLDRRTAPIASVIEYLDQQAHRRFIKSHMPFDGIPYFDNVRYIHVARDGRDACLSYHHHCRGYTEKNLQVLDEVGLSDETISKPFPRAPESPAEFFRRWISVGVSGDADGSPWVSWFNFENTYWQGRKLPNVLLVHYRDMKKDLEGEMRRIAAFLDIPVPESLWPSLTRAAGFEEMKKVGDKIHPGLVGQFVGAADHFFARGDNDRWHGVLSAEDVEMFEDACRSRLPSPCSQWLARGRLEGIDPASCD